VVENVTDYFALELDEGKLKYYLNFGDQTQIGIIPEVTASFLFGVAVPAMGITCVPVLFSLPI
jgi:hypothetical protein